MKVYSRIFFNRNTMGVFWFRREMEVIDASQGVAGLVKSDTNITGKSVNNVVTVDFSNNDEALQLAA